MKRVLLAALGLVIGWSAVAGAWHEQFAGAHGEPMVAVHHVRLTGHGGNNELSRKMLIEGREACEPIVRDLGKPVAPMPASGYPRIIKPVVSDVYYASNRIFTVSRSELYSLDYEDCSINREEGEQIELFSRVGYCRINPLKRTASGQCDMAAHARAAPLRAEDFPRMSGEAMEQAMEKALDAMAPAARRYAEANLKKARARRQAAPNAAPEVRTIAGLQCSVHHGHVLDGVICIADPTPETVPGLDPYPIMAASENLFRGGIALEVTSWFGSVVAERVEFSLRVPERMFEIPAGFKVTMQPPLRQR